MGYSVRLTESENVISTIQTKNSTGSYYGDVINLAQDNGRRFEADINVGAIGASATVDFEFQWSATSGGTYATVTGSAITQDTTGGKTHRVEVNTEQVLQLYPTARFMKPYLKTLVAATPTGVVVRSSDSTFQPITNGASAIGQIVNGLA